jgi:hypothetical protein
VTTVLGDVTTGTGDVTTGAGDVAATGFASCWLARVASDCAKLFAVHVRHNTTTPNHNAPAGTKNLRINFFTRTAAPLETARKIRSFKTAFSNSLRSLVLRFQISNLKSQILNLKS